MVQCKTDPRLRWLFHLQYAYFSLNHGREASIALEGFSIFPLACLQGSVVGFAVDSRRFMLIYVLDAPRVPIVQMNPTWNSAVLEVNATERLASLPPLPEVHLFLSNISLGLFLLRVCRSKNLSSRRTSVKPRWWNGDPPTRNLGASPPVVAGGKRLLVESMIFWRFWRSFYFFTGMFGESHLESHFQYFLFGEEHLASPSMGYES